MFPPLPLEHFSPRAQRLLLSAQRAEVERAPDAIARRLAACNRPAFRSVVEFERTFGGLSWGEDTLGIYYEEPMPDPNDPLDLDGTTVPIGALGVLGLFMNEAGEVITQPNAKSTSIVTHIEQRAMLTRQDWHDRYITKIRPALGARLTEALNLAPVMEATDRYEAWWETGDIKIRHIYLPEVYEARSDLVMAGSLDACVRVLEAARSVMKDFRVSVHYGGARHVKLSPEEAARIPEFISFRERPGAVRYSYGEDRDGVTGDVWVLSVEGAWEIQEYVLGDEGNPLSWITLGADGAIARDLRAAVDA